MRRLLRHAVVDQHGGEVPEPRDGVLARKGDIGRGDHTIPLDTLESIRDLAGEKPGRNRDVTERSRRAHERIGVNGGGIAGEHRAPLAQKALQLLLGRQRVALLLHIAHPFVERAPQLTEELPGDARRLHRERQRNGR